MAKINSHHKNGQRISSGIISGVIRFSLLISLLMLPACSSFSTNPIRVAPPTISLDAPKQPSPTALPGNTKAPQTSLSLTTSPSLDSGSVSEPYITTVQELTNIRKGPSTIFEIIEVAPGKKAFPVVGTYNDWWQIKLDASHTGWVYKPLVRFSGNTEAVESVPSPPTPSN